MAIASATLSGAAPDLLTDAIERYRQVETYRVSIRAVHGDAEIQSSRKQRVDQSDVAVLLDHMQRLAGRQVLHLGVTGTGNLTVAGVHRDKVWLDATSLFPLKVISHDLQDVIIETVHMEDAEIGVPLPMAAYHFVTFWYIEAPLDEVRATHIEPLVAGRSAVTAALPSCAMSGRCAPRRCGCASGGNCARHLLTIVPSRAVKPDGAVHAVPPRPVPGRPPAC